MSIEEDYFIPVRQGSVTDIQNLAGGQNTTQIDDVKYLRDKLFSALKIPQSYLTMGEGATEDKTTLAQKDIRFARTIQRLQRVVISELEKIGIIHLYTLGFRGDDLLSFGLSLNNPSKIAELQEIEHWKSKFDIAAASTEGYFSRRWVSENIFGMSNEEFIRNQREMFYDRKHDAALQQVAEAAAGGGGGLGGGLGGDLGGGLGGDLGGGLGGGGPLDLGPPPDAPTEAPAGQADAPAAGGADTPPGDESALLTVPPGSRPSRRLSKYEKSDYLRKDGINDKRGAGKRSQSYASIPTPEMNTPRTNNLGYSELSSLARGTYTEQASIYSDRELHEEQKILEMNNSVKSLIDVLDKKDKLLTEQKDETQ